MNKWLYFGIGVVVGVIVCLVLIFTTGTNIKTDTVLDDTFKTKDNPEYFEQPQETLDIKEFEVFQVLENGDALANQSGDDAFSGLATFYLPRQEGNAYYDNKVITVPKDKVVKVVGTFHYKNRLDLDTTVPVVKIMDKR